MSFQNLSLPSRVRHDRSLSPHWGSSALGRYWEVDESDSSDDDEYDDDHTFLSPRSGPLCTIAEKPEPDENRPPINSRRPACASLSSRHRLTSSSRISRPLSQAAFGQNNLVPLPPAWTETHKAKQRIGDDSHETEVEIAPLIGPDKTPVPSPRKLKRSSSHRTANTANHAFSSLSAEVDDRDSFSTSPPPVSILGLTRADSGRSAGYPLSPEVAALKLDEDMDSSLVPLPLAVGSASSSYPSEGIRSSPSGGSDPRSPVGSVASGFYHFSQNAGDLSFASSGSGSVGKTNSSPHSIAGEVSPWVQDLHSSVREDTEEEVGIGDRRSFPLRYVTPDYDQNHQREGLSSSPTSQEKLHVSSSKSARMKRCGRGSRSSGEHAAIESGKNSYTEMPEPTKPTPRRPCSEACEYSKKIDDSKEKTKATREDFVSSIRKTPPALVVLPPVQTNEHDTPKASFSPKSFRGTATRLSPVPEVAVEAGATDGASTSTTVTGLLRRTKSNLNSFGQRFGVRCRLWMKKVCQRTRIRMARERRALRVKARQLKRGVLFQRRRRTVIRIERGSEDK